jgi:hypothetical protein
MGKASDALRAAGYRRIPAWWATDEQIELIEYMVKQNGPEVNRIRCAALGVDEVDAAWRQHNGEKK